jgi:hypothetical protein
MAGLQSSDCGLGAEHMSAAIAGARRTMGSVFTGMAEMVSTQSAANRKILSCGRLSRIALPSAE